MILETKGPMGLMTLLVAMSLPLLDVYLLAVFSASFTFHDHPHPLPVRSSILKTWCPSRGLT